MRSEKNYSKGRHPATRPDSWKEDWWDRGLPNRLAAAYQAGRLVNQLNWHCQLALLVDRGQHEPAIDSIVLKLCLLSQEFVDELPDKMERCLQEELRKWRNWVEVEYFENLLGELDEIERQFRSGGPYRTDDELCVDIATGGWVNGLVHDIRNLVKSPLEVVERQAFDLGEQVDRGVRRHDVAVFLNRDCSAELTPVGTRPPDGYLEKEDTLEASHVHSEELSWHEFSLQRMGHSHEGGNLAEPVIAGCCVLRRFVNYHPVPGSILPGPLWTDRILRLSQRLGIQKSLRTCAAPHRNWTDRTCHEVLDAVDAVDRLLYSALCKKWFHEADEEPPQAYCHGPIWGEKKALAKWLSPDGSILDSRRIEGLVKSGVIWVRRVVRTHFEVFFNSSARFESARRRMEKDTANQTADSRRYSEND